MMCDWQQKQKDGQGELSKPQRTREEICFNGSSKTAGTIGARKRVSKKGDSILRAQAAGGRKKICGGGLWIWDLPIVLVIGCPEFLPVMC